MITIFGFVGAAVLATMLLVALHDLARRPAFRRLASRNLFRRRTEAILVVLGSSLGTAIIATAFLVGATFHASVRDGARTRLGPIDEVVTVGQLDNLAAVDRALSTPRLAHTDGLLTTVRADATIVATRHGETYADPSALVGELLVTDARRFGGRPHDTGLAHITNDLAGHQAIMNATVARTIGVRPGDRVTLFAYGGQRSFTVVATPVKLGLAGATDVIVAPGTLTAMARRSPVAVAQAPRGVVLVSNEGGVFDSADRSSEVAREIRSRLDGRFEASVESAKADVLADASNRGRSMGELFTGVGTFSVLAGVLLLVNLFVMLAEERKRELGLARAVGLPRWHLVRILTLEGWFYAVAAAFVGAFAGTGLAWLVARTTAGLVGQDDSFHLRFVAPTDVLVIAALLGTGLSLLTAWITSLRVARVDVIAALRDQPEVPRLRHELRSSLPAALGVTFGGALAAWGVVAIVPLAAVLGPPIALCSMIPLLRPLVGRRWSTTLASVGTLVWCIGVFTFLSRITRHTGVPVFVVQGVVMVAAAVGLATALDRVWGFGLGLLTRTGRGLAGRLGLAYPLEKVFRTGLLVGMYALIVFTLTFLVIYAQITSSHTATITRRLAAGADVLVDSNPSDPVPMMRLRKQPGVASVARIWRATPQFSGPGHADPTGAVISGFEASLLTQGVPHLAERSHRYHSDRAAFVAMLNDPHLIVVDAHFLDSSDSTSTGVGSIGVGSVLDARDPVSGRATSYRVIGLVDDDVVGVGAWASSQSVRMLAGPAAVPTRFHVAVDRGVDPSRVAERLEATLVANGVQAETFSAKVADAMAVEVGFLSLMQRYLSIGLVVGIFGMAVVMVRASRSRRRQIGMLRTLGFSADTVRRAFLVEASFISFQGIATGVGLGLVVSYQMLSRTASLGGDPLPYVVPWATVATLAAVPFAASLAVALIPASQACAVEPAEVLRLAD